MAKLQALSLKDRYAKISTPLLVINGENDTLLATEDSIDIATHAPGGLLNLYPAERIVKNCGSAVPINGPQGRAAYGHFGDALSAKVRRALFGAHYWDVVSFVDMRADPSFGTTARRCAHPAA